MENLIASIFGVEQWLIILVIVLVLFGGKKIPELLRGVGRGVGELQKGLDEGKRSLQESLREETKKEDPKPDSVVAHTDETAGAKK